MEITPINLKPEASAKSTGFQVIPLSEVERQTGGPQFTITPLKHTPDVAPSGAPGPDMVEHFRSIQDIGTPKRPTTMAPVEEAKSIAATQKHRDYAANFQRFLREQHLDAQGQKEVWLQRAATFPRMAIKIAEISNTASALVGSAMKIIGQGLDNITLQKMSDSILTDTQMFQKAADEIREAYLRPGGREMAQAFDQDMMSFMIGFGVAPLTRHIIQRSAPLAGMAMKAGISESLAWTGLKVGLVNVVGDNVVVNPGLDFLDKQLEEYKLDAGTKDLIRMIAPLVIGIGSGVTLENSIEKFLGSSLIADQISSVARQYGETPMSPKVFEDLISKIKDLYKALPSKMQEEEGSFSWRKKYSTFGPSRFVDEKLPPLPPEPKTIPIDQQTKMFDDIDAVYQGEAYGRYQFTDNVTKSTFYSKSLEHSDVQAELAKVRERFEVDVNKNPSAYAFLPLGGTIPTEKDKDGNYVLSNKNGYLMATLAVLAAGLGARTIVNPRHVERAILRGTLAKGLGERVITDMNDLTRIDNWLVQKLLPTPDATMARTNAHAISRLLQDSPDKLAEVRALEERIGFKFLDENNMLKMSDIERRVDENGNQVFAGFRRSLGQMYLEGMADRETFRQGLIKSVEHAYKNPKTRFKGEFGNTFKGLGERLTKAQSADFERWQVAPSIRQTLKTGGALNLNSHCPMFNVGANGCWLDACYLTANGKAQNQRLYNSAMYMGELLQLSDDAVKSMNKIGGLRINGAGDLSISEYTQFRDIVKHANMRKLKLKIVTKQNDTFKILQKLQDEKISIKNIVLQPSIDPYWVPIEFDQLARKAKMKITEGNAKQWAKVYKETYGRDAIAIGNKVYRKYGYSWDQIKDLAKQFPGVQVQPRVVVSTPKEVAEYALRLPEVLQTWMHSRVPNGMYSDIEGRFIKPMADGGEAFNLGGKVGGPAIFKGKDGEWHIWSRKKGNLEAKPSKPFTKIEKYIKDNYKEVIKDGPNKGKKESDVIFETLKTQNKKTVICCIPGKGADECFNCVSHCAQSTSYLGHHIEDMAERALKVAKTDPLEKLVKQDMKVVKPVKGQKVQSPAVLITSPVAGIVYGLEEQEDGSYTVDLNRAMKGAMYGAAIHLGAKPSMRAWTRAVNWMSPVIKNQMSNFLKKTAPVLIRGERTQRLIESVNNAFRFKKDKELREVFRQYNADVDNIWAKALQIGREIHKLVPDRALQKKFRKFIETPRDQLPDNEWGTKAKQIQLLFDDLRMDLKKFDLMKYSRFDKLSEDDISWIKNVTHKDPTSMTTDELTKFADELEVTRVKRQDRKALEEAVIKSQKFHKQRLEDFYQYGDNKMEYCPIMYDKYEGLSMKQKTVLKDEIANLRKKSMLAETEEAKEMFTGLADELQEVIGMGKRGRREYFEGLQLGFTNRRMDLPDEVKTALGHIDEVQYVVAKGIGQQATSVRRARMFEFLSENSDWVRDPGQQWQRARGLPTNFTEVPNDPKKYGRLAGKYIRKDIWQDLSATEQWTNNFIKLYDQAMGFWKFGKVILNPSTHARNFISNAILAWFADTSPLDAGLALKALKEGSDNVWMKEAQEFGLFSNTFYKSDLVRLRDELDDLRSKDIQGWIRKAWQMPANLYEGSEKLWKLAVFMKARKQGLSVNEAGQKAIKYLFDYSDIPPAIRHYKRWVSPFVTFTYKAMPVAAETAIKKPWKVGMIAAAGYLMESYARDQLGMSEQQVETLRKRGGAAYTKKMPPILGSYAQVLMPWRDHAGNPQAFDLTYILPYGSMGETWGQSEIPLRDILPTSPLFQTTAAFLFNEDPFTGQKLYNEIEGGAARLVQKYSEYAWRQLSPNLPMVPGTYSFDKLKTGFKNSFMDAQVEDWAGREMSFHTAILHSLLGLKLNPMNQKKFAQFELGVRRDLERSFRKEINRAGAQYKRNEISKNEYNAKREALTDRLKELIKQRK